MNENLNPSYRQERVTIAAQTILEVNFQDTRPNYCYFANNSAYNLYASINPLVSNTLFDIIIPPYSTKLLARPELMHQIYINNVSPLGAADLVVISFQAPFDPRNLPQTQEIVGASAAGLLGIIEVSQITGSLPAGTNQIGFVKLGSEIPAGTQKIGKVAQDYDATDNGGTIHRALAAASTNATNVKASAGRLSWLHVSNQAAASRFLKLYNLAVAPTVGTSVPVMTIMVPAGQSIELAPPAGIYFSVGISYAMTNLIADSDTTALTANDLALNLIYK